MSKYLITDENFLKQVKQWLELGDAIYIDIYVIHAPFSRLISSYKQFEELISEMDGKGEITVVRHPDYLLSGIANTDLLNKAIDILQEGKEWGLKCVSSNFGAHGSTHQELKETFKRFNNKFVAICNSDDCFPPERPPRNNEEVLVAEFR